MRLMSVASCATALLALMCACPQAKPQPGDSAVNHPSREAAETVNIPAPGQLYAPQGARFVWLDTCDGYHVAAWYFAPQAKKAPGVILLHQRAKDKSSWGSLPGLLVKQGYAVIAIDLRGHGQTTGPDGQPVPLDKLKDADYAAMLNDVAAADSYLQKQKSVTSDRIGIIGASIGANLAIMYLAKDRRVRTAVALSPGLDFRGLKPMESMVAVDKRPIYLLASKGDKYSAESAEKLSQAGVEQGPKSLRLFDGNQHGTDLLAANNGLDKTIVTGWLLNYLPPER